MRLNEAEIVWSLTPEPEDIPVRGNLVVSGDDEADKKDEDEVIERLDNGDIWAWCYVKVTGVYRGVLTASAGLGGCCYRDEAEFTQEGCYYEDMKRECIQDLKSQLKRLSARS